MQLKILILLLNDLQMTPQIHHQEIHVLQDDVSSHTRWLVRMMYYAGRLLRPMV